MRLKITAFSFFYFKKFASYALDIVLGFPGVGKARFVGDTIFRVVLFIC